MRERERRGQRRKYTKVHGTNHTGHMIEHKEKGSRIGGGIYREIGVRIMVTAMRKQRMNLRSSPRETGRKGNTKHSDRKDPWIDE